MNLSAEVCRLLNALHAGSDCAFALADALLEIGNHQHAAVVRALFGKASCYCQAPARFACLAPGGAAGGFYVLFYCAEHASSPCQQIDIVRSELLKSCGLGPVVFVPPACGLAEPLSVAGSCGGIQGAQDRLPLQPRQPS